MASAPPDPHPDSAADTPSTDVEQVTPPPPPDGEREDPEDEPERPDNGI